MNITLIIVGLVAGFLSGSVGFGGGMILLPVIKTVVYGKMSLMSGSIFLSGAWSRRINHKDRLVYQVDGDVVTVFVLAMRFHYNK